MERDSVLNLFLQRFFDDQQQGAPRSLAEYQAEFAGHEDLIAREYAALTRKAAEPAVASVTIGPYRVLSEIGRGGQGSVYLAVDRRLGRKVALKVLSGLAALDRTARARLLREAELASRLEHPSICTVYDSGEHQGIPYLAMRLVTGGTLADALDRRRQAGELPDRQAIRQLVSCIEGVARAVEAAHRAGIVHRDLKPDNIGLQEDGLPVVLDFGLARQEDARTLTRSGDLFGTPAYMAPEQIEGRGRSDPRTDVYALGAVLYECLTLQPPFSAPTRAALFHRIQVAPPPHPRRHNPQVPADLGVIVETALQKERARRYRSAGALADDLARLLAGQPIQARPVSVAGRLLRWSRREPWKAALLVLLALGLPAASAFGGYLYATSVAEVVATGEVTLQQRALDDALAKGYLALLGGAPAEALPQFEAILAGHPADVEALTGAAMSLVRLERRAEAGSLLQRAGRAGVDPRVVARLARMAAPAASAGPADGPQGSAEWFAAAMSELAAAPIWQREEAAARALDGLVRAAFLAPRPRPHVALAMAQAADLAGDRAAGIRAAATLEQLWPDSAVARWGVAVALARFEPERAMTVQERLLGDAALSSVLRAQVLQSRGYTLGVLGRHDDAVETLERAVDCDESLDRLMALAIEARAAGMFDRSIAALRRIVELEPESDRAFYNLGIDYRAIGRDDLAESAYREALRLRPDHAFAWNNLGNLLVDAGREAEAEECYRQALTHQPRNVEAHNSLGRFLIAQPGRRVEALTAWLQMIGLSPEPATPLWSLARDLDEGGIEVPRPDLIEALYLAALGLEPDHARCWNDYGFFLVQRGDMAGASDAFRKAAFADPTNAQYRGNLVLALKKLARWSDVRPVLEELHRQRPDVAGTGLELAAFLVSEETPDGFRDAEAARTLATALLDRTAGADLCQVLLVLGRAQQALGRQDEAEDHWRRALEILAGLDPPPPQAEQLRKALQAELDGKGQG